MSMLLVIIYLHVLGNYVSLQIYLYITVFKICKRSKFIISYLGMNSMKHSALYFVITNCYVVL